MVPDYAHSQEIWCYANPVKGDKSTELTMVWEESPVYDKSRSFKENRSSKIDHYHNSIIANSWLYKTVDIWKEILTLGEQFVLTDLQ